MQETVNTLRDWENFCFKYVASFRARFSNGAFFGDLWSVMFGPEVVEARWEIKGGQIGVETLPIKEFLDFVEQAKEYVGEAD